MIICAEKKVNFMKKNKHQFSNMKYYIIKWAFKMRKGVIDMPEILNNINLIIMENDYQDISHKKNVDDILIKNNFYRDYVEPIGWCENFFEVWKKI